MSNDRPINHVHIEVTGKGSKFEGRCPELSLAAHGKTEAEAREAAKKAAREEAARRVAAGEIPRWHGDLVFDDDDEG